MFTLALVLILFVLFDYGLESLENHFTPEELTDMGICLEGSLAAETR